MRHYLEVLRSPGVSRLLASQLIARFPAGMLAIALLIHMEQRFGAYAPAGLVVGVFGVGLAVSGPLGGRLLSRFGMRPTLLVATSICAVAMVIIALIPMPLPAVLPIAAVIGLTAPPIQPASRTLFPHVVRGARLGTLFTMDATFQEIIFILGPLTTTTVAAVWDTRFGIIAAAILMVVGGLWFISTPIVGSVVIPRPRQRLGAVLREPVVLLMAGIGFAGLGAWGAVDAAIIAGYGHDNPITGVLLGIAAVGSFIGGFATGSRPMTRSSLAVRSFISVVGIVISLVFIANPWLLGAGLAITGASSAPIIAVMNASVSASVRQSQSAEAFGWLGTAMNLGGSAASALAGVAIDAGGAGAGMTVSAVMFTIAFLLALVTIRIQPDLSSGEVAPRTDTVVIPVVPAAP